MKEERGMKRIGMSQETQAFEMREALRKNKERAGAPMTQPEHCERCICFEEVIQPKKYRCTWNKCFIHPKDNCPCKPSHFLAIARPAPQPQPQLDELESLIEKKWFGADVQDPDGLCCVVATDDIENWIAEQRVKVAQQPPAPQPQPQPAQHVKCLLCIHLSGDCPQSCIHSRLHSFEECNGLCPKDLRSQMCSPAQQPDALAELEAIKILAKECGAAIENIDVATGCLDCGSRALSRIEEIQDRLDAEIARIRERGPR
jgi:hypothetical protein